MSPRQTRRGTIRLADIAVETKQAQIRAKREKISKIRGDVYSRETRIQKSISNSEDEQMEKDNNKSKERRARSLRAKSMKDGNKSSDITSSNEESTLKLESSESDKQSKSSRAISRSRCATAMPRKLDVTFSPETPSIKQADKDNIYTPVVTPKSSPIAVNLTPHRTSKTPRKSPVNLASPKTHSKTPLTLCKTPRKLPVTDNSPTPSIEQDASSPKDKSSGSNNKTLSNTSSKSITLKVSPPSKKKSNVTSIRSNQSVRRFSKSPKIVLRSPKMKSRKSKSPKVHSIGSATAKVKRQKLSGVKRISLSSPSESKIERVSSTTNKDNTTTPPLENSTTDREPRIMLEKLSPLNDRSKKPSITKKRSLSKTPSKLLTPVKSSVHADDSNIPKAIDQSSENTKEMLSDISPDVTTIEVTPASNKKKKVTSTQRGTALGRFSKSPKIVLRTPKAKSRISKSPKLTHSIKKTSLKRSEVEMTEVDSVMLSKLSPLQKIAFNSNPRIVLEKLNHHELMASTPVTIRTPVGIATPIVQVLAHGGESPKRTRSMIKKRSSVSECGTPLRPTDTPKSSSFQENSRNETLSGADITSLQFSNTASKPVVSSTPRDKMRRLSNLAELSHAEKSQSVITSPMKKSKKDASPITPKIEVHGTEKSIRIEDVSQPFNDLSDFQLLEDSHANSTFEMKKQDTSMKKDASDTLNKTGNIDNDTYELLEPKTPNLQQSRKRTLTDANLSFDDERRKRVCKVRFASTVPDGDDSTKGFIPALSKGRASTPYKSVNFSKNNTPNTLFRRRSHSTTDIEKRKSAMSQNKIRSISSPKVNPRIQSMKKAQETPTNKSINRSNITSSSKKGVKTPIGKKVPNFQEIHQKAFAGMESLMDVKNRVRKRHLALTSAHSNLTSDKKKVNSSGSTGHGIYNRFGFKIRKNDAKDIVLSKQPFQRVRTKQEENRVILKGVRTNRRFELQMQARSMK